MSQEILKLLEPKAVLLGISAENSTEIIRLLGNELFKTGYVKESFIEAAIERESRLPTGLPLGGAFNAAIPHTDIEHVNRPALALGYSGAPSSVPKHGCSKRNGRSEPGFFTCPRTTESSDRNAAGDCRNFTSSQDSRSAYECKKVR